MNNLIEFGRMFFSYLFVLIVIAIVAAIGLFIGITIRKRKNAQEEAIDAAGETEN